jgi:hypothetical protein
MREPITIRNEAMPAINAVASDIFSGMRRAVTSTATSHAMTTPNISAAVLRNAACEVAPE